MFDAWSSMPRPRYPFICPLPSAFIVRSYYLVFASAPHDTPPIVHLTRSFYDVTSLSFIIYPVRSFFFFT